MATMSPFRKPCEHGAIKMTDTYSSVPGDNAQEEATRAVQVALDRRDNGGEASKSGK